MCQEEPPEEGSRFRVWVAVQDEAWKASSACAEPSLLMFPNLKATTSYPVPSPCN